MTYGFRKIYADLVADDGTVCIAYASWIEACGLSRLYAGLERYYPDGRHDVARARRAWLLPPGHEHERLSGIRLDLPDGIFELRYESSPRSYRPSTAVHPDGMHWRVHVAGAEGEGRWCDQPERPVLRGVGYADWVELRRLTRSYAMQRLRWGRAHLPTETLIFNAVEFRSGARWQRAVHVPRPGAAPRQEAVTTARDFVMDWRDGHLYVRSAGGAGTASTYRLRPQRVLREGPAIDRERFPGRIERWIASAITGPNSERRWLSRAHREDAPGASGWAVHEEVVFGQQQRELRVSSAAACTTAA